MCAAWRGIWTVHGPPNKPKYAHILVNFKLFNPGAGVFIDKYAINIVAVILTQAAIRDPAYNPVNYRRRQVDCLNAITA